MRPIPLKTLLLVLCLSSPASAVVIDWVTIGNPGNACETQTQGCFGGVSVAYRIAKTEVTNTQYADFLNAVADADPNGLWISQMGSVVSNGGITRSGTSGSYVYTTIAGREDMPVIHCSFYDALRFANWLHNGQPIGVQGGSTTEGGAYTITAQGITDNSIVRNPGAMVSLASEDEWYKAAFYDPVAAGYNNYPAGSNATTVCSAVVATANRANCNGAAGDLTEVASYTGSASPYGVFDLGGNAFEWNEAIIGSNRGTRGGGHLNGVGFLAASNRNVLVGPAANSLGFRVSSPAATPPGVPSLGTLGLALLLTSLVGFGIWRLGVGRRTIVSW